MSISCLYKHALLSFYLSSYIECQSHTFRTFWLVHIMPKSPFDNAEGFIMQKRLPTNSCIGQCTYYLKKESRVRLWISHCIFSNIKCYLVGKTAKRKFSYVLRSWYRRQRQTHQHRSIIYAEFIFQLIGPLEIWLKFRWAICKIDSFIDVRGINCGIALIQMNTNRPHWCQVDISSGASRPQVIT